METLNKFLSRKLMVFLVSTALLCFKFIDQNIWLIVASVYVGGNVAEAFLSGRRLPKLPFLPQNMQPKLDTPVAPPPPTEENK